MGDGKLDGGRENVFENLASLGKELFRNLFKAPEEVTIVEVIRVA